MAENVRQLTSASSLDNLKKEAKRWLKALRAGDEPCTSASAARVFPRPLAELTLRDVQHALALEHGVAGWSALKQRVAGQIVAR